MFCDYYYPFVKQWLEVIISLKIYIKAPQSKIIRFPLIWVYVGKSTAWIHNVNSE